VSRARRLAPALLLAAFSDGATPPAPDRTLDLWPDRAAARLRRRALLETPGR